MAVMPSMARRRSAGRAHGHVEAPDGRLSAGMHYPYLFQYFSLIFTYLRFATAGVGKWPRVEQQSD
eukprot:6205139-Pleurochrysis_carterae.AAC.4